MKDISPISNVQTIVISSNFKILLTIKKYSTGSKSSALQQNVFLPSNEYTISDLFLLNTLRSSSETLLLESYLSC